MAQHTSTAQCVSDAIEPIVSHAGFELVLVELSKQGNVLRIYIDKPGGIGLDDCSLVSRRVSDVLDAESAPPPPDSMAAANSDGAELSGAAAAVADPVAPAPAAAMPDAAAAASSDELGMATGAAAAPSAAADAATSAAAAPSAAAGAATGAAATSSDAAGAATAVAAWACGPGSPLAAAAAALGERYTLEVSSPGLDRPLVKPAHFSRFVGQQVSLQVTYAATGPKRHKLMGTLLRAGPDGIVLASEDGELAFDYAHIDRARLVPTYERL